MLLWAIILADEYLSNPHHELCSLPGIYDNMSPNLYNDHPK
jgi:hypothetical protein